VRNSHRCPKCQSADIVRTPGVVGAYGAGNNIALGWMKAVKVTRYLCASCGFSEEWIDDPADIRRVKDRYSPA
jgi:predicted Zn-ribbon and HTH transcriptional regulator